MIICYASNNVHDTIEINTKEKEMKTFSTMKEFTVYVRETITKANENMKRMCIVII